jgi:hypothetical protein
MREAGMTMNDRVALARAKRINKGDVWPGDRPDFDGSVRHVDWKTDASSEYVGHRAKRILCVGYARDGVVEIRL